MNEMFKERFKYYDEDNNLHIEAYEFLIKELSEGNCIMEQAYKFLCWLHYNNRDKFPSPINKPHIPDFVEISEQEFRTTFCNSDKRIYMFEWLIQFSKAKVESFNINYIDVLFGGSFVNSKNEVPKDVDFALMLDPPFIENIISKDYEAFLPNCQELDFLDIIFISNECSFKDFWFYATVTHFGNVPSDKSKCYINNAFQKSKVFKIRLSLEL